MKERWGREVTEQKWDSILLSIYCSRTSRFKSAKMWFNPVVRLFETTWLPRNAWFERSKTEYRRLAELFLIFLFKLVWSGADWWTRCLPGKAFDFEALSCGRSWTLRPSYSPDDGLHRSDSGCWADKTALDWFWDYSIIQSRCLSGSNLGWIKARHRPACHSKVSLTSDLEIAHQLVKNASLEIQSWISTVMPGRTEIPIDCMLISCDRYVDSL